jgi:hypothetical protein
MGNMQLPPGTPRPVAVGILVFAGILAVVTLIMAFTDQHPMPQWARRWAWSRRLFAGYGRDDR